VCRVSAPFYRVQRPGRWAVHRGGMSPVGVLPWRHYLGGEARVAPEGDATGHRWLGFIFTRCSVDQRGAQCGGDGQMSGDSAGWWEEGDDEWWAMSGCKRRDGLGALAGRF
jgi:hypothetical protein